MKRHSTRFDTAHIKDIIDQIQQMSRALADLFQIPARLFAECIILERDTVQSDDRVHRRADLMAHAGEERGFSDIGMLRLFQRKR